jgi:hypothetical protein
MKAIEAHIKAASLSGRQLNILNRDILLRITTLLGDCGDNK